MIYLLTSLLNPATKLTQQRWQQFKKNHLKKNKKAIIGFVGIGAFFTITIPVIIYLVESFLKDLMISLSIAPSINYFVNKSISFILFISITWLFIGWIVNNVNSIEKNIVKYLFASLGVYIFIQIMMILYSAFESSFFVNQYNDSYKNYIAYSKDNIWFLPVIDSVLGYLKIFVFTGLIYFKLRNSSKQSD